MSLLDEQARLRGTVEFISGLDSFALDLETSTYSPLTGRIIGLSVSGGPDTEPSRCVYGCCAGKLFPKAWYFQFSPEFYVGQGGSPDFLPLTVVLEALRPLLEDPKRTIEGANIKFDLKFFISSGINVCCQVRDVVVASQLLDENRESHGLKKLAKLELDHDMVEFKELGGLFSPPISQYGADDACQTHRLEPVLAARLEAEGLLKVYQDLWCRLIPILARMELAGIPVDIQVLEALRDEVIPEIAVVEAECWRLAGQRFDVASSDECRRILFRDLKFTVPKDALTGQGKKIEEAGGRVTWEHTSTAHAVLEDLEEEEKARRARQRKAKGEELKEGEEEPTLVGNILRHRELQKLATGYINPLIEAHGRVDGRIRSSFNQVEHVKGGGGTVTGRLSNSIDDELGGVNMQTIPARSATGKKLRFAFVSSEGFVLLSADYSNIELRVLAHLSNDPGLISAFCDWTCVTCGATGSTKTHFRSCPKCGAKEGHSRPDKRCLECAASTRPEGSPRHGYCEGVDFHQKTADAAKITRDQAKAVNFGVIFGIGAKKLARQMGCTTKEAEKALAAYFSDYVGVDQFSDSICLDLRKYGHVKTLLGRRRRIPGARGQVFDRSSREWRQCMSARVQGGAADILQVATRNTAERLRREGEPAQMLLSVHDELVLEAREDRIDYVKDLVREEMEAALRLRIPLVADVRRGTSWGAAKK
jgi:DNA polymerase-1